MANKKNQGLLPLIVQDAATKQVLSLFWCNGESIRKTRKSGYLWRYSRKAGKVVKKGSESGNVQKIVKLSFDCDNDAVLAEVEQQGGGACHRKLWSCFSKRKMRSYGVLDELCRVLADRRKNPRKGSYVSSIINNRKEIGNKLAEEAGELGEAVLMKPDSEAVWEAADLLFFTLVAIESRGIDMEKILLELKRRRRDMREKKP